MMAHAAVEPTASKAPSQMKKVKTPKFIIHMVSASDTWQSLEIKYGVPVDEIRAANKVSRFSSIKSLFDVKIPVAKDNKSLKKMARNSLEQVQQDNEEERPRSKSCNDFFSKIDSQMAKLKVSAEAVVASTEALDKLDGGERSTLLNQSLMTTKHGALMAENRAQDRIEAILTGAKPKQMPVVKDEDVTSNKSEATSVNVSLDSSTENDQENDLFRDLDLYNL